MKKKIAIIGAGVSGLSLGYYLSKKNFDITIFEKEKYSGGLLSNVDANGDMNIEKFYHHIFTFDKELLALFKELGLSKDVCWHESSNSVFVKEKFLSFSNVWDYLKFPDLNLSKKIRLLLGGFIFSKKKLSDVEKLKAEYAIKKYMGEAAWQKLWEPLFKKKFGGSSNNILASWFWWRMNVKLGEKRKELLGYPIGGFGKFLNFLESFISKNGGNIFKDSLVDVVEKSGSFFIVSGKTFDKVIFTIPNKEIKKVYKLADLKVIEYRAAINIVLILKKKQTNWYWNNILDKDIPFVGLIEHTNLVGNKYYNNKSIIYLTQYLDEKDTIYSKNDNEIYNEYKKYFYKVFIDEKDIEKYFVSKSKYAQPVLKNKPVKIGYEKIEDNVYAISMEHIYPEDRGINQAVKYAKDLVDKIS